MLMCPIARHELKSVHINLVHKQDDTGKHNLDEVIEGVLTGTHYDRSALKPIYDAYQSINLAKGCSAWKLREAIGSRLLQED